MIYGISKGHNTAFNSGASGCGQVEDNCTKDIGDRVISKLRALGEKAIDCTPPYSVPTSLTDSLARRCDIANESGVDLYVEIHMNCFSDSNAHGTEIYCNPDNRDGYNMSQKLLNGLINIGWTSRGVKDGNWLYVIKHTNMTAILIETCFISNPGDMSLYNAEKVANAIVQALTGKAYTEPVKEVPKVDLPKDFNSEYYYYINPDVKAAGMDAATHYLQYGYKEGRSYVPSIPKDFDAIGYWESNLDILTARVDPWNHYLNFGWKEGRTWKRTSVVLTKDNVIKYMQDNLK